MDWKEKINKTITGMIGGALITGLIAGISVESYFANKNLEKLKNECDSKLASIKLVSDDSTTLNLSKLIIGKNDPIPNKEKLKYYPEGQFYAKNDDKNWEFFVTDEYDYRNLTLDHSDDEDSDSVVNENKIKANLPKTDVQKYIDKINTKYPIYLWKYTNVPDMQCGGMDSKNYPFVTIQKVDDSMLLDLSKVRVYKSLYAKNNFKNQNQQLNIDSTKIDSLAKNIYYNKWSGFGFSNIIFSSTTLDLAASLKDKGVNFDINKIEETEEIKFSKITWEEHPCIAEPNRIYYQFQEVIVMKVINNIYIIQIIDYSAAPNPDNHVSAVIKDFIANLRIVKN